MKITRDNFFSVILPVSIIVIILIAGGFFLFPLGTPGMLFWICLAVLGQVLFVGLQVKGIPYKCSGCGKIFFRSIFKEIFRVKDRGSNSFNCPDCKIQRVK